MKRRKKLTRSEAGAIVTSEMREERASMYAGDNEIMENWQAESDPDVATEPCMACGVPHAGEGDFCQICEGGE